MPDYKLLYHQMVAAASDAVTQMETGNFLQARRILILAMMEAENAVMDGEN